MNTMENTTGDQELEQKRLLVEVLKSGMELAMQLQVQINVPSTSSLESREILIGKILDTYENALSVLNLGRPVDPTSHSANMRLLPFDDSPASFSGSALNEVPDRDHPEHNRDGARKRNSIPKLTGTLKVGPGTPLEAALRDGFNWRKYGQKDILHSKFPRGYYRCTQRSIQGCLATKQVQRSNEDPTVYEVTYCGWHTCNQISSSDSPNFLPQSQPPQPQQQQQQPPVHIEMGKLVNVPPELNQETKDQVNDQHQQQYSPQEQLLTNLQTKLKVITDHLDSPEEPFPDSTLNFTSTSSSMAVDQYCSLFPSELSDNYVEYASCHAPPFVSPSPSTTIKPQSMTGYVNFQGSTRQSLQELESHFINNDPVTPTSNSTSVMDDRTVSSDTQFASFQQCDPNFTSHNHGVFFQ